MKFLGTALAIGLSPATAQAATFTLSYDLASGETLGATIDGTLLGDANRILVGGISGVTIDGAPRTITFFDAVTEVLGTASAADPLLSLDGTVLDLLACNTSSCLVGFFFDDGDLEGYPLFSSSEEFAAAFEPFDRERYSLTAAAPFRFRPGWPS
ncbi:hypothetical protein [Jannaschia formosa]|uniref:hypothetical protein n=1 Tax=Jannaschia formosa TaxID=2259592 RepID=UPI001FD82036|nr:hypothetical protein [Jannaschia formosa]